MRSKALRGATWAVVVALLAAMAGGVAYPPPARGGPTPPTLTVTNTGDVAGSGNLADGVCETVVGLGVCTLRAAVMEANHYPGGGVTIVVPAGTYALTIVPSGAFTEAAGSLDLDSSLTLIGAGAATTIIDAGGLDRVLCVRAGAVATVSGVTLRNGRATSPSPPGACNTTNVGGGMSVYGDLTLVASVVRDNAADFGGGISNEGRLRVEASAVIGNRAYGVPLSTAGGIRTSDPGGLTLTNSTVSNNLARWDGGGVYASGDAAIVNSTIAGNLAGADGQPPPGYLPSVGGGVVQAGSRALALRNTLLANNYVASAPGDCEGTITSQDYNLIGTAPPGCTVVGATANNVTGEPLLEPLADNGGATPTRALLAGSPALDRIPPAQCVDSLGAPLAADQRGVARPQNGMCDIGGFEGSLPAPLFGRNLVRNGGGEASAGSPAGAAVGSAGWEPVSGNFTVGPYGGSGISVAPTDPGPPNRGANLFAGGPSSDLPGAVRQTVSLAPVGSAIDTGRVRYALSAYLGGFGDEEDRADVVLTFRDAGNVALGTVTLTGPAPAERGNQTGLLSRAAPTGTVPAGTRVAEVELRGYRIGGMPGFYNDAYFDNVSLVLSLPPVIYLPATRR
jgi:hypothetical protein